MVGRASTQDLLCYKSDASFSSSDESFCLQIQVKSTQAETKLLAPRHLVTNLMYKLKPHKKRIKYLRARMDTCTEANLLPLSVHKLIFKDPDCEQPAPSTKVAITTFTTDKINIVGSCSLFAVHPDTSSLKQVTFYVTSHEGSVILLCGTSLKLNFIHPHSNLNHIPDCASLIYSNADHQVKRKSKKSVQGKYINQCVLQENKSSTGKQEYKANVYIEDDKNFQVNMQPIKPAVCSDKQCQETPNVHMWPVKPAKESNYMQSVTRSSSMKTIEPEILQPSSKQNNPVKQVKSVCNNKNFQTTQHIHMCTAMESDDMQSVTKPCYM